MIEAYNRDVAARTQVRGELGWGFFSVMGFVGVVAVAVAAVGFRKRRGLNKGAYLEF